MPKAGAATYIPVIFTVPNTVLVALFQTGLITLGVLISGTNREVARELLGEDVLPGLASLMAGQGIWLLLLPLAWVTFVLLVRRREDVRTPVKLAAFLSGLALALVLGVMFYAVVSQTWGQVDWGFGGDGG